MTTALVTGGNQGLGFALVRGLCKALGPDDTVYLTARSPERGQAARDSIGDVAPQLRFERLDVTDEAGVEALASTIDAAWQCHSDHEVGSLEAGKLADFVVLDADPREVETSAIASVAVLETWVDGVRVFPKAA